MSELSGVRFFLKKNRGQHTYFNWISYGCCKSLSNLLGIMGRVEGEIDRQTDW